MLRAFLLIVVGLAGDPEHGELFQKWGTALADASEKVGVTRERLVYLGEAKDEGRSRMGRPLVLRMSSGPRGRPLHVFVRHRRLKERPGPAAGGSLP